MHGSWLNLVESFFAKLTKTLLRGMRVESKEELKQRIELYIDRLNDDPVVYKWTYKMDEISVAKQLILICYFGIVLLDGGFCGA